MVLKYTDFKFLGRQQSVVHRELGHVPHGSVLRHVRARTRSLATVNITLNMPHSTQPPHDQIPMHIITYYAPNQTNNITRSPRQRAS